ncbi:cell envelope biogenesis protein OmpA [Novosphingobium sp. AAP83]|uniref:OmpA family protein n=1 Tax=Novosphingobium sp. AAP83 TaxID=1523425 RepID=UPI0006B9AE75|nr:OmpA family protein [Novosphingobium sp. AAP83]KPF93857.1 cell envelope biogenesis protein OmpA [Novosphingobium sp. AAP83]
MKVILRGPRALLTLALLATPCGVTLMAQELPADGLTGRVTDTSAPVMAIQGARVEGVISARRSSKIEVTSADGTKSIISINDATLIEASAGPLGLKRTKLAASSLLNGLPVRVKTLQFGNDLVANKIDLKSEDLKTAQIVHNGTAQRFSEHAAATEALRGRMANIDKYSIKSSMNVAFDVGKSVISSQAKSDLCDTANQAAAIENSLMLVVGYTDSTGNEELNQRLSEARAARVVNYLQQVCGWKPYRMLTPTGLAAANPAASNDTVDGKAKNRRVTVNVMVSKVLDGL